MSKKVKVAIITGVTYILGILVQQGVFDGVNKPPTDIEVPRIDIRILNPIVGHDSQFWQETAEKDNLGSYDYLACVYCIGNKMSKITYSLNQNYSMLIGDIALVESMGNTDYEYWIDFYDGNRKIGATKRITGGVSPTQFVIDVKGVDNLKIVANGSSTTEGAYLLTKGFFLIE